MSMHADIISIFRQAHDEHGVSKDLCVAMYIDVIGALEWDYGDTDFTDPDWIKVQHDKGMETLFPDK